jgi:hypothetical protein
MPLFLDKDKITYKGKVVGRMTPSGGDNLKVQITLEYEAPPDRAILPVAYLSRGLSLLDKKPSGPQVKIVSLSDEIEWVPNVPRTLTERTVARDGHIWVSIKTMLTLGRQTSMGTTTTII